MWKVLVLVLLVSSIACGEAQRCQQAAGLGSYALNRSPSSSGDPLAGGNTVGGCVNDNGVYRCIPRGSTVVQLVDGELGAVMSSNVNNSTIHAWSRSTGRVEITYTFIDSLSIRNFNLFFYNVPSMGIGLPNIELFAGTTSTTPLPYFLTGNQDISRDDNGRRNVTLSLLEQSQSIRFYRVEFDFADTDIDWLILSEMVLCSDLLVIRPSGAPSVVTPSPTVSRPVEDVSPNLTLSCSVSGEGMFSWQWTNPDGDPPSEVMLYDTTRTSTAVFTRISSTSEGMYQCEATPLPAQGQQSGFQDINVQQLQFSLTSDSSDIMVPLLDNVTMACEISGYFPPGQPQITWTFDNTDITDNIVTRNGSGFIQNGEEDVIASIVSELSIFIEDSSYFGPYVCQVASGSTPKFKFFTVGPISDSSDSMSSDGEGSTASTGSSAVVSSSPLLDSTTIAIIAVAGTLIVIILLVIIAIVVLLVLRRRSANKRFKLSSTNRKDSLDYTGEPFYQEVPKPAPPPLPDHFPDLNPDIEAYAVVSTVTEANGGMEMQFVNRRTLLPAVVRLSDEKETSPELESNQHPFLEKNPLYASTDNIDDDKQALHRRRLGSVPSLDVLTDSPTGSQLNIYADPSRVAPPIPNRPPTPELTLDEPVYSEAGIKPSAFKSREPMPSPLVVEEDQSLPCFSIYADPQPLLRSEGPKEVTPQNVKELRNLGVGQFGEVVLAETIGLSRGDLGLSPSDNNRDATIQVAVKRLKASAEAHVKQAFEKEIKFMSRLRNENVVRLLGICPYGDMFIIMEYMENGDLNQFIHKRKLVAVEATPSKRGLTAKQLTYICSQIAGGMKYLAAFNFIHRDLATRNCLVGADLKIKIADFGMSRSLYSSDYYRISGRAMLPIRWMANECFYGKFSEKTDVWAFGVTMWEVFTFSREQPYQDMSDQEVIDDAIKGPDRLLPARPNACPAEVYEVMKQCWIDDPDIRTGFKGAHASLLGLLESGMF